ncbi:MAG: flagellar basal body-associated FliL family protein [Rhodocyclales bacterium]|nr:flagellar basal body-associated FliL family protein [Rhodocyclales bacterium]
MADAKKTEADAVVAPPKKSRSKWILFAVIGVLLLAGGGAAAFFLLKKPPQAEGAEAAAPAKKKVDPAAAPVFYKFDKPFTVKLATEQQDAYLQTEVQLKLLDAAGADVIKQNEPELKHRITLMLMGRKASMLSSSDGVQRLANEIRDTVNKVVSPATASKEKAVEKPVEKIAEKPADGTPPKTPEKPEPAELADPSAVVQSVLFSSFIVQ